MIPAPPPIYFADRAWRTPGSEGRKAVYRSGEGHGAPNLRSGLPHSPPEAEGLGELEEEVAAAAAAPGGAAPALAASVARAAAEAWRAHLVHPKPVLSSATRVAPRWRDHSHPHHALPTVLGLRWWHFPPRLELVING